MTDRPSGIVLLLRRAALGLEEALHSKLRARAALMAWVYFLAIGQFLILGYDPRQQIPTAADRRAGEEFVAAMRATEGDVYMPCHGYLPDLAGKRSYDHAMAIWDVARGRDEKTKQRLLTEITDAIRQRRFAAVIVDSDVFAYPDLEMNYLRAPIAFEDNAFWPVTGMRTRPKYFCLPRR